MVEHRNQSQPNPGLKLTWDTLYGAQPACLLSSPVLLAVGGAQLQVNPEVEDDEGGEGDDAGDDELVPPRAEGDVVLVLVQLRRPVVGVIRLGVGAQLELEEARHRQSSCKNVSLKSDAYFLT